MVFSEEKDPTKLAVLADKKSGDCDQSNLCLFNHLETFILPWRYISIDLRDISDFTLFSFIYSTPPSSTQKMFFGGKNL